MTIQHARRDTYDAVVLADSANPVGARLVTMEVTFPRIVLAEFNTHRMLSRNSASSRAIPVEKRIAAVREAPFVPEAFAANKRGMQAGEELDRRDNEKARDAWLRGLEGAIAATELLLDQGVHKQWANRLLEPFSWHTVIVSATEWSNFFALRCHPNAQPEIRRVAKLMRTAFDKSMPVDKRVGEWHLPLLDDREAQGYFSDRMVSPLDSAKISIARCARVSYLTHDGKRDPGADLELYEKLAANGHLSPFEHAAIAREDLVFATIAASLSNFRGWTQMRKLIANEHDYSLVQEAVEK